MGVRTDWRPNRPEGRKANVRSRDAEGYRGRPGRPIECCREAFDDAEQQRGDQGARKAPQAAEDADREDAAI